MNPDKLTTEAYWDRIWSMHTRSGAIQIDEKLIRNYADQSFHAVFKRVVPTGATGSPRVLEVGCGGSQWLPYFARQYGASVEGIDYSETGCRSSRELLRQAGVQGTVHLADAFEPPVELVGKFDFVYSLGFVEHFHDTTAAITACAKFLAPGGILFTLVPNIAGIIGSIQQVLDRSIYDAHVPIRANQLRASHEATNLAVLECNYLLPLNLSVVRTDTLQPMWWQKFIRRGLAATTLIAWFIDARFTLPRVAHLSPYVYCVAQSCSRPHN